MRSLFHAGGPFVRKHPWHERVGISTHVMGAPSGEYVEVTLVEGGETYVGPAGNGESVLAALVYRGLGFEDFVARVPSLRGAGLTTPKLGVSPLGSHVAPLVSGRAMLVGDAAGAPDPVTGEGMSLALRSAAAASSAIMEALETGDPGRLARYERERRRLAEPSASLSRLILWTARRPRLANRAVRRLARDPSIFCRFVRYLCAAEAMGPLDPLRLLL
jgi:flavin-dependent dehydrogenase